MATMANFLSYDVYNIDVSKVSKDSDWVLNRVGPAVAVANTVVLHLLKLLDQLKVAPFWTKLGSLLDPVVVAVLTH